MGGFPFIPSLFRAEAAFPATLRGLQWLSHDTKPTRNSKNVFPVVSIYRAHTESRSYSQIHNSLHSSVLYFCCLCRVSSVSFLSPPKAGLLKAHILDHRVRTTTRRDAETWIWPFFKIPVRLQIDWFTLSQQQSIINISNVAIWPKLDLQV